jgi:cytochrome c oxidase accessory protein FixG
VSAPLHIVSPAQPLERVLSTLNVDGSRRWIRPRPSGGPWLARRRAVAWVLIAIFVALPYVRIGGKPAILLDLPRRAFTLFGGTFHATDTFLFMLLFLSLGILIFLVTALFGRVWCGWGCPQTVYLEFVFRPIERWIEKGFRGSLDLDRRKGPHLRRLVKNGIYLVLAAFLAHVFLAYFVGVDTLAQWVRRSPVEHPTGFLIMLGTTAAVFLDFAWFREQTCLVACPYGRLQSVMLDRRSLIVGYDVRRGEPRAKGAKQRPTGAGDCIDCQMCVMTCPTGIDIREGLQMECIHCTQCMDACDTVMDKIGRPRGLIRYSSRDALEGRGASLLRPRVLLYPAALAVTLGLFAWNLGARPAAEVTLLRGIGAPYRTEADGSVSNQVRIKIANQAGGERRYRLALEDAPGAKLIAPINPFPVPAGATRTTTVFVVLPDQGLPDGELDVRFLVDDGEGFSHRFEWELVGPEPDEHDRHDGHDGHDGDGNPIRAPGGDE